ncbi:Fructosamine kinase-domain-containing protein [Apiospora arundinis]|uniref:protein-ribulosamine 3-kinase n=1 Tax=Apiospora arundinis TaxID=335852 RepID=A0ABR2HQL2_9PEZI
MVLIDAEFEPAKIPEEEAYEGTEVDPHVYALLPKDCKIVWVATHGASFWAVSYKITVQLSHEGPEKSYFMKVFMHERGSEMVEAEYESTKAWHDVVPANLAKPTGWGELANKPGRFFILLEFRDMADEMPSASEFVAVVATAHQKSVSPTGKFGFHVTTFAGDQPNDNRWCNTWEEWFTRAMKNTMENELRTQGSHQELEELSEKILTKVIPRLLRPMETDGRKIKPSLLHGDLWHGNVGIDNETDEPVLYDCGSFYGHNECDFSSWRAARYRTNRAHVKAYFRIAEITDPAEDFEDRYALYAARNDLAVSTCWPANKRMRTLALDEFRRLVEKYADGYEGYENAQFNIEGASQHNADAFQKNFTTNTELVNEVTGGIGSSAADLGQNGVHSTEHEVSHVHV